MTFPTEQEEFSGVCPYLGLADDADSHATFPTEAHRCYRLPNPTRIASTHQDSYCLTENHMSCPVYLGEGVPGATRQAPAAALPGSPAARGGAPQTVRGPQPREAAQQQRSRPPLAQAGAAGGLQAPRPRKPRDAGSIGPRPRSGGVSMPVATIGLFALALVVIGIAFAINSLVSGGGGSNLSPADQFATNQALTTKAGGGQPGSQTTTPAASQTAPAGTTTPGAQPAGSATAAGSTTAVAGGAGTYTVKAGDTCGAIASANGLTLAQLEQLNGLTDATCQQIKPGDVLKLK